MGIPYFLENAVKTALNLCSWLFFEKRVNEHWKICEISPISRFWILTVQIIFEIKKSPYRAKFWIITVKIFISSWLGEMNSYTINSNTTKKSSDCNRIGVRTTIPTQGKFELPNVSFNCLLFVGRYYQTIRKKARAYKSITNVLVVDFFSLHSTEVPRCVTTFKSNIHVNTV